MAKPMNMMDRKLLSAFLLREMYDFKFIDTAGYNADSRREIRANEVTNLICIALDSQPEDYWSVTFESMTNLGQTIRSLELSGYGKDPKCRLTCVLDTKTPGRFAIQPFNREFVRDMPGTFPPQGANAN